MDSLPNGLLLAASPRPLDGCLWTGLSRGKEEKGERRAIEQRERKTKEGRRAIRQREREKKEERRAIKLRGREKKEERRGRERGAAVAVAAAAVVVGQGSGGWVGGGRVPGWV